MKMGKLLRFVLTVLLLMQCLLVAVFEHTYFGTYTDGRREAEDLETMKETSSGRVSDEPGELYALSAVLMDADSGRILFGKNEEEVRPMASTTKIMTCILTLEHMEEGQTAKASKLAAGQPKVHLGMREGESFYIRDLLYSLMLESHNDSAVMIAEAIGGSVEDFAAMMNDKAKEIGCENTHFVTPNGLDGEDAAGIHATTAADLARIMRYCISESPKSGEFLKITGTRSYTFADADGEGNFSCTNHNAFLDMMDGAFSGKTGFTAEAGYCYVGALKQDERTFIVALLACGWPGNKSYKWKDTRKLMEYALANYEYRDVYKAFETLKIPVEGGASSADDLKTDCKVKVGLKEQAGQTGNSALRVLLRNDEEVRVKTEVKPCLNAPVHAGETVGQYLYLLDGTELRRYDIVTLEDVEKRDFAWCMTQMFTRYLM